MTATISQRPKVVTEPIHAPGAEPNSPQPNGPPATSALPAAGPNVDSSMPMVHVEALGSANLGVAGMLLFDPLLSTIAAGLDDAEALRIAQSNRLGGLTRTGADKDGVQRGFGLDETHPVVKVITAQLDSLKQVEHAFALTLARQLRKSPLHPWIKSQHGLGERQMGRLLAAIRDPYWNDLHDRPRTVSELWAFCGLHVVAVDQITPDAHTRPVGGSLVGIAPRRRRGQKMNWSTEARTRAYVIAESCMKHRASPYRAVYDDGRAKYAESIHSVACPPCSALPGAPLKDGHKHARAMRLVMKAVLRDLWIESKRIYETKT